jgi:hypothetical protein
LWFDRLRRKYTLTNTNTGRSNVIRSHNFDDANSVDNKRGCFQRGVQRTSLDLGDYVLQRRWTDGIQKELVHIHAPKKGT